MTDCWGYTEENGPSHWAELCAPAAAGHHQSPIDIIPADAVYDAELSERPLRVVYATAHAQEAIDNGASCQVTYDCSAPNLEGGPVEDKYSLAQFHFHWGKGDKEGSEHTVDGKPYAGELHLVHYNSDKYKSVVEAVHDKSGLCVLGMFLQVGKEHHGLKKLTDKLEQIQFRGDTVDMQGFDTSSLLPDKGVSDYWTYDGSLTQPPCLECVKWIVFREPLEISEDQLTLFRHLHECYRTEIEPNNEHYLVENHRPLQPIYGRTVRATFRKFFT